MMNTAFSYAKESDLRHSQRDFLTAMLDRYGPNTTIKDPASGVSMFELLTLTALAGTPPNILIDRPTGGLGIPGAPTARYAAVPDGLTVAQALALTPDQFTATAGKANLQTGRYNRGLLYTPKANTSLRFYLQHNILPEEKLTFTSEFTAGQQRARWTEPKLLTPLFLDANNPRNPFRNNVTPGFVGVPIRVYYDSPDFPDATNLQLRDDARLLLALNGKVRDDLRWSLDFTGQYGRTYSRGGSQTDSLGLFLTYDFPSAPVDIMERWRQWNPFVNHTLPQNAYPTQPTAPIFSSDRESIQYLHLAQGIFRVMATDLYTLPSGPIQGSISAQHSWSQFKTFDRQTIAPDELKKILGPNAGGSFSPSSSKPSDNLMSEAVELRIPVLGRKWHLGTLKQATLEMSHRWERPNRSASVESSVLAGNIELLPGFVLRGALTDGYAPLSSAQTAASRIQNNLNINVGVDPKRPGAATTYVIPLFIDGSNPNLLTPSGKSKSIGLNWTPPQKYLKGLRVRVTYGETKRINDVGSLVISDLLNFPDLYPGRIERAPLEAGADPR